MKFKPRIDEICLGEWWQSSIWAKLRILMKIQKLKIAFIYDFSYPTK